jgi:hypothetical protein
MDMIRLAYPNFKALVRLAAPQADSIKAMQSTDLGNALVKPQGYQRKIRHHAQI